MNPGLAVKLRPTGPWRVGPDSGARNRVDFLYHSDSLYSAVTQSMARMGTLDEWLAATARAASPAVCFSSCFPFLDEIRYVIPPRTLWPPSSPAQLSARVRWKSARFVPLEMVQAILAGRALDDNQWMVDGPSECLAPAGRSGPFRTAVRWSAAVDRLTGAAERHSTACIEFRPGAGLWTVVSFLDEAARARWMDPVKAAFRWLADAGFGGERSRGWGRSEAPEFIEGMLPDLVLMKEAPDAPLLAAPPLTEPRPSGSGCEPDPVSASGPDVLPEPLPLPEEPSPVPPVEEPPSLPEPVPPLEDPTPMPEPEPPAELPPPDPEPEPPAELPPPDPEPEPAMAATAPAAATLPTVPPLTQAHWLLSLFAPAAADTVDWARGSYTVLARGGRVDSPLGSGELKKQVQMVTEGSVVYADSAPCGSAPDVAPDGFAHPVFRAGFAVAIPLPELH